MIFDAHTHIYDDAALSAYFARSGGRVARVLTLPYFKAAGHLEDLDAALAFASRHDSVFAAGTADMTAPLAPQIVRLCTLLGENRIHAVKLYPGYQSFYPHDHAVDAIAELCAEFNRPLIFHSGITHSEFGGTHLKYSRPEHVDDIAVRHPRTNFILCHFGFPFFMDAAAVLSDNHNVYADLSGVIYGNADEREKMLRQVTADLERVFTYFNNSPDIRAKILFGTDFIAGDESMDHVDPYFRLMDTLYGPEAREHAYGGLAERLFLA